MKISSENNRISVTDNPELALTPGQQKVFEHWSAGFDAQARGVRFEDCPAFHRFAHKIRKLWREGWLCGAAVDRIKAGWLVPEHTTPQPHAIRNENHTEGPRPSLQQGHGPDPRERHNTGEGCESKAALGCYQAQPELQAS